MSANNWTECPQCLKKHNDERAAAKNKADHAYGKVSYQEFTKLKAEAESDTEIEETLREDWELGVDSRGKFSVSYGCSCDRCGFSYQYKFEENSIPDAVEKPAKKRSR